MLEKFLIFTLVDFDGIIPYIKKNLWNLQVIANSTAWFTSEIIVKWQQYNYPFNSEPILLLLDEFTEEVVAAA
jgi:hypothetical protein